MSSASLLAVGIFARESGQRLLTILDKLVDSAFRGLYDRARGDCASEYYQTGLRRVAMWTDETLSEDVARVRGACPDVEETVQQCFTLYVTERFDGKQRPTIACPPLLEFVRKFLDAMGQQRVVMDGSYFVRACDPIATRFACTEAARIAFFQLVSAASVRVECASTVAGSVVESWAPAPPSQPPPRHHPQPRPIETCDDDIVPEDSISNVGPVSARPVARAPVADGRAPPVGLATQAEERPEGRRGGGDGGESVIEWDDTTRDTTRDDDLRATSYKARKDKNDADSAPSDVGSYMRRHAPPPSDVGSHARRDVMDAPRHEPQYEPRREPRYELPLSDVGSRTHRRATNDYDDRRDDPQDDRRDDRRSRDARAGPAAQSSDLGGRDAEYRSDYHERTSLDDHESRIGTPRREATSRGDDAAPRVAQGIVRSGEDSPPSVTRRPTHPTPPPPERAPSSPPERAPTPPPERPPSPAHPDVYGPLRAAHQRAIQADQMRSERIAGTTIGMKDLPRQQIARSSHSAVSVGVRRVRSPRV